ncbi:hypothetical protein [Umezawaea beigongshangensis]|uniref:hypothetical protein n=1 Tax=Umezawaea beigongshangensis TaxID=2780383 RepID=UPI0018F210C1|nr:hypothetical protein [Umezawaea beigongshangensis]
MITRDTHVQDALTEAVTALNRASDADATLKTATALGLAGTIAPLVGVAKGVAQVVANCTTSARRMSEQTEDAAVGEAHHGTRLATRAAARTLQGLRAHLVETHTAAWNARAAAAVTSSPGVAARDHLEVADRALTQAGNLGLHRAGTDPIALASTTHALPHIADRLVSLIEACRNAAHRLAEQATTPAEQTAHRDTEHAAYQAVRTAHSLRRTLATLAGRAQEARALAVRKCPECGEAALAHTPDDLTPAQRNSRRRPAWSHRDGTQLCPVMGTGGYEPAKPV